MVADRPARDTETEDGPIEITREMIEAGSAELRTFNHDFDDSDDVVVRIYLAMNPRKIDSLD
jgi:hypothetical protein